MFLTRARYLDSRRRTNRRLFYFGAILKVRLRRVQCTFLGGEKSPPFLFRASLLLRRFLFPFLCVRSAAARRIFFFGGD